MQLKVPFFSFSLWFLLSLIENLILRCSFYWSLEWRKTVEISTVFALIGCESMDVESSPPSATARGTTVVANLLSSRFRFHPTNKEVVSYNLNINVLVKLVHFNAIGEVGIYKWDLKVCLVSLSLFLFTYLYDLGYSGRPVSLFLLIWILCGLVSWLNSGKELSFMDWIPFLGKFR